VVAWTLRYKWLVLGTTLLLIAATVPVFFLLGSEFMPPMDEGTILYMPTTMPGISIAQSQRLLQVSDAILKQFPEVDTVLGKAGRADTPTDPAPLSMSETLITLKPRSKWRRVDTWYSGWAPEWAKNVFRHITPDSISTEELISQMDAAVKAPGVSNAWTMPIKGRIDMLSTGMRTPVGLKIAGGDLNTIETLGAQIETALASVRGTRAVFAERTNLGHFVDISWRREELARYGISIERAQTARYSVNVRYMRDYRSDLDSLGRILVPAGGQRMIPISELATIQFQSGPAMIRDENGLLTGYVYVDLVNRDSGSYIAEASKVLHDRIALPPGFTISWSGQFEAMQRTNHRLRMIVPITIGLVFLLILINTRSLIKASIVLLAVPFSAVGAIWLVYLLHYNISVAVWVGIIGLMSIDAETGVFMLLYLDLACEDAKLRGCLTTLEELRAAIMYGAAKRLRPKFMTFATACIGLFPVMWSVGAGSDVMKRIAAPMVGGIFTSFALELLVYPCIYELWKRNTLGLTAQKDTAPARLGLVLSGNAK
jgi:Cu(I)/Ag(I) efflux system membrane protein CusA/SilA